MDPLFFKGNFYTTQAMQPIKVSASNLESTIASLQPIERELIAHQIGSSILHNLGVIGKGRVKQEVVKKNGLPEDRMEKIMYSLLMQNVQQAIKKGEKFLTDQQAFRFVEEIKWLIKDLIAESFSCPQQFLQSALTFKVSEYEPEGILKEIADKMKLELTLADVPPKYQIYLELDKELTLEKSELVFNLIEESESVKFSKKSFTIKELIEKERA